MQLTTGTLLQGGKYKIESVLGQGAYGITYLATATMKGALGNIAVKVAIKEFFSKELNTRKVDGNVSEVSSDSLAGKYSNMFLREARNLSHLKHDGIVNVLEAFSENNTHYYVMEYVDGGSLDAYIRSKGRLSERETLSLARQIGSALSFMHENKMLHLDLKPKNIMLRADGTLCLIDFGLSKQYEADGEPESSTTIGLGTPGYAPLEQGDSDDRKTFAPTLDIYAFGATLFKMLTGKTPPRASDIFNEGFPEDELLSLEISEETISAIRHAMSPRKGDRPQTVEEFLALLKDPIKEDVGGDDDENDSEDIELEDDETEPEDESDDEETPLKQSKVKEHKLKDAPIIESKSKSNLVDIFRTPLVALAILLPCILGMRLLNNSIAKDDAAEYMELIAQMDSLVRMHNGQALLKAKKVCEEAVKMETHYAGTRHAEMFNCDAENRMSALISSRQLQEDIENKRLELEREQAEKERLERERKERAEKERIERERKEREEADKKRRETGYSNGILKVNGIEYPMVYVSGGSFMMGSEDSNAYGDEKPVHRVTLSSYRIGKYEVTQDLWEAVMGSNPSRIKGARKPVEMVSWDDCQTFIRKLNSLTGQNFKLPTEAQWEFAARGGNSSRGYKYSGSNYIDNVGWYLESSGSTTHNVGAKSPNELGIYDMTGNVEEWCRDWCGSYSSSSQADPEGPSSGSHRVGRGGDCVDGAWCCHITFRNNHTPDCRYFFLGFRLCL